MSYPLRWDPDLTKADKGPSILRDPLRAGLAAAGIALAIGSLRPWAEGTAGLQPQQFGGFDGPGDGAILLFFAIGLLLIARDRLANVLGGRVVEKGHRIEVRELPTSMSARGPKIGSVQVALPARVYADLMASGGRATEAANHLREVRGVGPGA